MPVSHERKSRREVNLGLFQRIKLKVLNLSPLVMVDLSCMVTGISIFGE